VANDVMSVLSDNEKLGEFAAQNLIEGLRGQGRDSGDIIVLTGTKSMLVTQDRMRGFYRVLDTAPQYQVIDEQDANWDPQLSGTIAQQLLARHGRDGVQAAYGMADYMALPIIEAAKQAGFPIGGEDGLIVTSSNCFRAGIDSIRAGELYGTATEDPGTIARQAADYVVRFLTGQNPPQSEIVQEERVTAENLDEFAEQCSHV
jgi:ABC-type sugar transport system substrate-binding protein